MFGEARLGLKWKRLGKASSQVYYRSIIIRCAEFPTVSLLFRSGWVGGEIGNDTNLSPAGASLMGLSLQ